MISNLRLLLLYGSSYGPQSSSYTTSLSNYHPGLDDRDVTGMRRLVHRVRHSSMCLFLGDYPLDLRVTSRTRGCSPRNTMSDDYHRAPEPIPPSAGPSSGYESESTIDIETIEESSPGHPEKACATSDSQSSSPSSPIFLDQLPREEWTVDVLRRPCLLTITAKDLAHKRLCTFCRHHHIPSPSSRSEFFFIV